MESKKELLKRLNEITSNYSFIKILSTIVLRDFCGSINEIANKNADEHLNYNEVFFLMGLWVKNVDFNKNITSNHENALVFGEVYSLMESLHLNFLSEGYNLNDSKDLQVKNNPIFLQESMFYSGTGAYDYQYVKWVQEKYKYDREWLLSQKSLDISLLYDFYDHIKRKSQLKLNSNLRNGNPVDLFCLSKDDICSANPEYESILKNFTFKLGHDRNPDYHDIGDYNLLSEKPILLLPNGMYLLKIEDCFHSCNLTQYCFLININKRNVIISNCKYNVSLLRSLKVNKILLLLLI